MKNNYEDDDFLLVQPIPRKPKPAPAPDPELEFGTPEGCVTVEDMSSEAKALVERFRKTTHTRDDALRCIHIVASSLRQFCKDRNYNPAMAPRTELLVPLFNREKFPPKSHQYILQHLGAALNVKVAPKKNPTTGNMMLAFTGSRFYSVLLECIGKVLLPCFDVDLNRAYKSAADRATCKQQLEEEYIRLALVKWSCGMQVEGIMETVHDRLTEWELQSYV